MTTYAFIFARGGSSGLPGKNIRSLGGLPLLAHAITLAKQIKAIKKVYVSTDSNEIATVALDFSAEVIKRPAELASNTASEWLSWQHAVHYLYDCGEVFDTFLSLPTTSPLRSKEDVEQCLALLSPDTDLIITVTPSARSPYFNMVSHCQDGYCKLVNDKAMITRRQDVPRVYDMTTVAYVTRPTFILNNSSLFAGKVKSVIIPKERAIDIDDIYDFMFAETLYNNKGLK